jgi:hypothetical protein
VQFTTNFEVKSRVYDVSKARHSCRSGECSFELEYGSDEAEVIVTPDTNVVSVLGQCGAFRRVSEVPANTRGNLQ